VNRLVNATIHSLRGLRYTIANETAVRQEAITLGLAILLGFSLSPGLAWYVAMIGVLLVLLAVELLNTAIEKLSDHVTPEHHVEIGIIKDAASAAVFCLLLVAILVWVVAISGGLIKDRGLFGNDRLVLLIGQTGHAIGWQ
jgi:diacylglycerol kinase (ATP)